MWLSICVPGETYYSGVTTFFFLSRSRKMGHVDTSFVFSHFFCLWYSQWQPACSLFIFITTRSRKVYVFRRRGMCAVGISHCCKSGDVIEFSSHRFIVLFVVSCLLCFSYSLFFFSSPWSRLFLSFEWCSLAPPEKKEKAGKMEREVSLWACSTTGSGKKHYGHVNWAEHLWEHNTKRLFQLCNQGRRIVLVQRDVRYVRSATHCSVWFAHTRKEHRKAFHVAVVWSCWTPKGQKCTGKACSFRLFFFFPGVCNSIN